MIIKEEVTKSILNLIEKKEKIFLYMVIRVEDVYNQKVMLKKKLKN
ncbi:ORF309 [Staphylococcus phage G1]|uniref:ORF309 n=1 Tax=Staphylococcus phage G1 TaxID=2908166 RepID=Q4Z9J8_9CAUD|nr:ORF309 [Staphylococcus phage G1]AAX92288.1 ORF309 [Staphylococcus phage G1]